MNLYAQICIGVVCCSLAVGCGPPSEDDLCSKPTSGSYKGGLLLHFDEPAMPFADSSGWGNKLNYSGGVFSSTDAVRGRSALFDGTGRIDIHSCKSTNLTFLKGDDFTIDFWFKSFARMRQQALQMGDGVTTGIAFNFADSDVSPTGMTTGLWIYWNSEGKNALTAGERFQFTDGQWHHIAAVRSAGQITGYIDGKSIGAALAGEQIGSASLPTTIGSAPSSTARVNGLIDELRILNGAALWTKDFDPTKYVP